MHTFKRNVNIQIAAAAGRKRLASVFAQNLLSKSVYEIVFTFICIMYVCNVYIVEKVYNTNSSPYTF